MTTTTWVAGFRSAVLDPTESFLIQPSRGFRDQSVRQILHLDGGGGALRVLLGNEYGKDPLVIGAARVAVGTGGSTIDPDPDTVPTFGGSAEATIPAGGQLRATRST
ncbi:hypothetical protein [Embleya sp. NPDC001921]